MDTSKIYESKYFNAKDVKASPITGIINKYTEEPVARDPKAKPIIGFADHEKRLIINPTNMRTLWGLFGTESNSWIGKRIEMFSMPCTYGSDMTEGLRVRAPKDDEPPF